MYLLCYLSILAALIDQITSNFQLNSKENYCCRTLANSNKKLSV